MPRYVQAPALRDHGMGPRNIFWGIAMLFVAFLLLVVAIFMVGGKAMFYLATGLLTFTALFVLARLHVFRQRNGGFLALGLVCMIGTAVPLLEKGYEMAKVFVNSRVVVSAPTVATHSDEQGVPLLTQSFAISEPQGDGKQVKVVRDTQVVIGSKPFQIKAGDRFPLITVKGDQTTFAARDLLLSLPSSEVEVIDPSALAKGVSVNTAVVATPVVAAAGAASAPKSQKSGALGNAAPKVAAPSSADAQLAETILEAQKEAMRRYPALSIPDSIENAMFVSTYKELRDAGSEEFFADAKWPLHLADLLAKREGWVPGGAPMTTGPAPVLDGPAGGTGEAPAATIPAEPAVPADALDNPLPGQPAASPDPGKPVPRAQPVRRAAPVSLPRVDALDAGDGLPRAAGPAR